MTTRNNVTVTDGHLESCQPTRNSTVTDSETAPKGLLEILKANTFAVEAKTDKNGKLLLHHVGVLGGVSFRLSDFVAFIQIHS